jgi:uncharacterized protein GlcG (DUF336 family)
MSMLAVIKARSIVNAQRKVLWSAWKCRVGLLGWVVITSPANAQGVPQGLLTVRELSIAMALEIAQGALEACRQKGANIGVSVVDRGGHVMVTLRDDGAAHHTVELAQRKAYTARIFRQTTREFVERIINNPRAQGLKDTTGVLASLGGVPIKIGEETIGGVGVSGAPGGPNDEACAQAGIDKVADRLK